MARGPKITARKYLGYIMFDDVPLERFNDADLLDMIEQMDEAMIEAERHHQLRQREVDRLKSKPSTAKY